MLQKVSTAALGAGTSLKVLGAAGVIKPYSPLVLARIVRTLRRWGTGPAGGFASVALRIPDRAGIADELGELTFAQIHARSNALARGLRELGVGEGDGVAIMCRNHRGFIEASIAAAKLGADALYLNTAFAGPQLVEVLERDEPAVVVHDEEFTELVGGAGIGTTVLGWTDDPDATHDRPTLESLIADNDDADLDPPERHGRTVILTSGTTGTPKGAPRNEAGVDAAVALLDRIPLRAQTRMYIAAPLFHTWGFAHLALGMLLGTTAVLRRKFDPEEALDVMAEEKPHSVVVIPVMLQRIMALPTERLEAADLSAVQVITSSGSAIPGDLAARWMDRFGDHLYSTYGSTEVAYGSIATPADMRQDPATAGRAPYGVEVAILDDDGKRVADGTTGRIFVGNNLLFEGYTGGGHKDVVDGLMSSGDVGRIDGGLLYVEGRDDEMIVSGGENVFPQEVEDCLARHDDVEEVAAIGVDDDDFGKRLRAFVVRRGGQVSEDELKALVKDNLARYKVPREIVFIDELPRNATGKVLKRDLVEREEQDDDQASDASRG